MALRIILTTGGTGGHIFPALAVAEALKKRHSDAEILFVGGLYGQEKVLVPERDIPFIGLPVSGLQGKGLHALTAIFKMSYAILKSVGIIKKFKPDAIAGFGGYAAFPTLFAGMLINYPCLIHEQNAIPGTANKFLGKFVKKVCLSWDTANGCGFPITKCKVTGNPVRADFFSKEQTLSWKERPILIMGGSGGATAINSIMMEIVPELIKNGIPIIHQTGKNDHKKIIDAYTSIGLDIDGKMLSVHDFINDMPKIMRNCRMAICRAGATSMAELAATGTPAIYIPFPFAIHDHQTANALAMEQAGGGILIDQKKAITMQKSGELLKLMLSLCQDEEKLEKMSIRARTLAQPNAAEQVAEQIELLIKKK